jgi:ABC-type polysaccharide/polyol phosphate transport system ATPase subunit
MRTAIDVIALDRVTLLRRLPTTDSDDLKRRLFDLVRGAYRPSPKRKVLDAVDLHVPHGSKIGIIGPNGAGKSTLLRVISGILRPTTGTVRVQGRVAPLLELGAGFDPDLSVDDNIVLYAALLGYGIREIRAKHDAIVDFAEMQEYRRAPVRALSSGMRARLGFSVATAFEPDILLLDEILAVGDERFRAKSQRRIEALWKSDRTIVLVSHDLAFIRLTCERALWIDDGTVRKFGDAGAVVAAYTDAVDERASRLLETLTKSGSAP